MAKTYTSIPTTIEAVQWTGDNADECLGFANARFFFTDHAEIFVEANSTWLPLVIGEWIAKDSLGFYPIADSVFKKKYREDRMDNLAKEAIELATKHHSSEMIQRPGGTQYFKGDLA